MVVVDWAQKLDEPKVHEIVTLGWEDDARAKQLLTDAARQVQPIMKKRGWIVPLLTEFYPPNTNLLGLNIGGGGGRTREVRVRLRDPFNKSVFYPYDSILGTMLHELVHNVQGPHDSKFYKLLDELTEECEQLMAKGISGTGQGFDGPSAGRLGAHSFIAQHNPEEWKLREVALKAAEERAKRQKVMVQGPRKLGGGTSGWRHLNPGEAAAKAAERRARDNVWCPNERLAAQVEASVAAVAAGANGSSRSHAGGPSQPAAGAFGLGKQPLHAAGAAPSHAAAAATTAGGAGASTSGGAEQGDTGLNSTQSAIAAAAGAPRRVRRGDGAEAQAVRAETGRNANVVWQPGGSGSREAPIEIDLDEFKASQEDQFVAEFEAETQPGSGQAPSYQMQPSSAPAPLQPSTIHPQSSQQHQQGQLARHRFATSSEEGAGAPAQVAQHFPGNAAQSVVGEVASGSGQTHHGKLNQHMQPPAVPSAKEGVAGSQAGRDTGPTPAPSIPRAPQSKAVLAAALAAERRAAQAAAGAMGSMLESGPDTVASGEGKATVQAVRAPLSAGHLQGGAGSSSAMAPGSAQQQVVPSQGNRSRLPSADVGKAVAAAPAAASRRGAATGAAEVVDLTADDEEEEEEREGSKRQPGGSGQQGYGVQGGAQMQQGSGRSQRLGAVQAPWACPACTFENTLPGAGCEMCGHPAPS